MVVTHSILVAWMVSFVMTVVGPGLFIPRRVLAVLEGAEMRTVKTEKEEFYCLTGTGNRVFWYYKPKQHWEKWTKETEDAFPETIWVTEHARCKSGTIADYHTHPRVQGNLRDCKPSVIDILEWDKPKYDYQYHTIGCYPFGKVEVHVYDWERAKDGDGL